MLCTTAYVSLPTSAPTARECGLPAAYSDSTCTKLRLTLANLFSSPHNHRTITGRSAALSVRVCRRSDLEDSLMRLSQPAAEATWHAMAELVQFSATVSRLKSLFGAGLAATTTNPLRPEALQMTKYPSQTGILPEALWVAAVSGVRTKFNSIAIDLTPIDADLCRAFTRGRGVDRFAGTQGATFYERTHTAIESMAAELKGKYRVTENPMRAGPPGHRAKGSRGADSTNEMEKIARL